MVDPLSANISTIGPNVNIVKSEGDIAQLFSTLQEML